MAKKPAVKTQDVEMVKMAVAAAEMLAKVLSGKLGVKLEDLKQFKSRRIHG